MRELSQLGVVLSQTDGLVVRYWIVYVRRNHFLPFREDNTAEILMRELIALLRGLL